MSYKTKNSTTKKSDVKKRSSLLKKKNNKSESSISKSILREHSSTKELPKNNDLVNFSLEEGPKAESTRIEELGGIYLEPNETIGE